MKNKPAQIKIGDDTYSPAVLRVVETDELGRPLLLRVVREDEKIQLSEDPDANRFQVVLAKEGGGLR